MSVKITDLPQAPSVQAVDKLEIVDVSDPSASPEGTSKHIDVSQLPFVDTLGALTDVTITTPQNGDLLIYNGAAWVNADPGFGALAFLDTVGSAQIDTGAVGSNQIAADAVGASEIAADAVGSSEIAEDAVQSTHIATDAVGTDEIAPSVVLATPRFTGYNLTAQAPTISTGSVTIPYDSGNAVKVTVNGNLTNIQITGWPTGVYAKLDICLQVDATGGYTIDLSGVTGGWPGGTPPTLENTANARHRLVVVRDEDGQIDWTLAGQNYS